MDSQLDNLNGSLVASLDVCVFGQGNLREADGARVRTVGGSKDLQSRDHGVGHVHGSIVRAISAKPKIDIDKSRLVAAEPTRLESDSTASRRPVCAVVCGADTAAC